jgi:predicted component of type VI protein secretion system
MDAAGEIVNPIVNRRLAVLLAALVFLAALVPGVKAQEPAANPPGKLPDAAEIDTILHGLSDITGFRVRRQLPFQLITRDQVNAYVKDQIKQSVRPKEIHAEELSLKKLGFVPADFDLKQTTIDLLTEQAAAFYDFHRKKLFISEWAAASMRDEALVHELAHALADQNYNIEKYLNRDPADAEESLARQTVVEGQASWLTVEYAARQAGKTLTDAATAREYFQPPLDPDSPQYPVFSKAPLYLRATMLFPYEEGESFQQAVVLHDGKAAFGKLFTSPPVSTSQVLHPERYFAGAAPVAPELPKPAGGMKVAVEGVFGEEDMQVLLRQYVSVSVSQGLAPGLTGGRYRIDTDRKAEGGQEPRAVLLFATAWDTEDSAIAFLNAYRTVLEKKWKTVEKDDRGGGLSGKSEDGYYRVERTGKTILSREGFRSAL